MTMASVARANTISFLLFLINGLEQALEAEQRVLDQESIAYTGNKW